MKSVINQSINEKDTNKLDLALRTQYHLNNRGQAVDTTNMQFNEVLNLDPVFYSKTITDLMLPKNSVMLQK